MNKYVNNNNNNPVALQPTEGQGLPTDCWPHRDERSSNQFRGDMKSASQVPKHRWFSRPGLPLQISVYQIPHDAGLTQIPYAAFQSFP